MDVLGVVSAVSTVAPFDLMLAGSLLARLGRHSAAVAWRSFVVLSGIALLAAVVAALTATAQPSLPAWLHVSALGLAMAVLVQLLGTVIAAFSQRYLEGEPNQRRYVSALGGVLASVHVLLLADHWLLLIGAWALAGVALRQLLCFYPERAFAQLAAHKKQIADRLADALLLAAAALAWHTVGSGSLSALWAHLDHLGASASLQASALALVLAVILRTALLPVHGWLIQVMEAPTPVSALLHAGVVNLGGFVLVRFAPLLDQAPAARAVLVMFGLATAVAAGMVMLTRITIKVRLAWSTVAQMGFMLLECGLGLYSLAALHLLGHSLYKAHAFLSASSVVRDTRLRAMRGVAAPLPASLAFAPLLTLGVVQTVIRMAGEQVWPWWWSAVLALAWAPLLWLRNDARGPRARGRQLLAGLLMVAGLTGVARLAHAIPFGLTDRPGGTLGVLALLGMAALYLCLVVLQLRPEALRTWRRWSYAGFYVDEAYTRLALQLWPARWAAATWAARPLDTHAAARPCTDHL